MTDHSSHNLGCWWTWIRVYIATSIILLSLLIVDAVGIVVVLVLESNHSQPSTHLGHIGDVVVITENENYFWTSSITLSESLEQGDYTHENFAYLVSKDALKERSKQYKYHWNEDKLDTPQYDVGAVVYQYLLVGSHIHYTFCLSSMTDNTQYGTFYVFKGQDNYRTYANSPDQGDKLEIFKQQLEIKASNEAECTDIDYTINESGNEYYFMMANVPGQIEYSYNITTDIVYYSHTDYQSHCEFFVRKTCDIDFPDEKGSDVAVLVYIQPNAASDPITTHIQLDRHQPSKDVAALLTAEGVIALVIIAFMLLATMIQLCVWCRVNTYRHGYVIIDDSLQSG